MQGAGPKHEVDRKDVDPKFRKQGVDPKACGGRDPQPEGRVERGGGVRPATVYHVWGERVSQGLQTACPSQPHFHTEQTLATVCDIQYVSKKYIIY